MTGAWRTALGRREQGVHTSAHLLTALLAAGLAAAAARIVTKLLQRPRCCSQDAANTSNAAAAGATSKGDEVTASAKLIAAWRALESLEPRPLFVDPLAYALAGSEGMSAAIELARPWGGGGGGGRVEGSVGSGAAETAAAGGCAPGQPVRRFRYSNVSIRVWWFDQRLTAALSCASQPRQVVVLGAGLDTRPWRMALPPDMHWWEVDMPHVVAAKRRQLEQLGAALTAAAPAALSYPLRAAAWQAVPADLEQPGWGEALQEAGLDVSRPVVWVAEGLLMYLSDEEADDLLRRMAELSPPGSLLIAHNVTTELLRQIEGGGGLYGPFKQELVATWRCFYPPATERPALAGLLQQSGWRLAEVTTRARIAAAVCSQADSSGGGGGDDSSAGGGAAGHAALASAEVVPNAAAGAESRDALAGWFDFEACPDQGEDRFAVFFTAQR